MPIHHLVEDRARLLAFHFFGDVAYRQVENAVEAVVEAATPEITYRSILVFHETTDLSKIGPDELRAIRSVMNTAHKETNVRRPASAIVIDGALDARIIMPLWKAVCDADSDIEIHYRFFIEVAPALAWLDVLETPALRTLLKPPR